MMLSTTLKHLIKHQNARMAEWADAADLKSASTFWSMGSSPIPGTINFYLFYEKHFSH